METCRLGNSASMESLLLVLGVVEEGSGLNLSRYRMSAPAVRTFLRINILALLSVCAYQSRPTAAMPHSYRHNVRQASTQVH